MKRGVWLVIFMLTLTIGNAQELRCNVRVNSSQISGTNRQVFDALERSITNLMNDTKWTDLTFKQNEKIECNIGLIIKKVSGNLFTCEVQIQSRRPVWGSNYHTNLLNLYDKSAIFSFSEFDQLNITPAYENNIVAIMAYYAYLIIGYDMDSFQKLGGTKYFEKAQDIVNVSQSRSGEENAGWLILDRGRKTLRYDLISNLLDERFRQFREYFYDYHRLGLDQMSSNIDNARAKISEGLPILQQTYSQQPNGQIIIVFIEAKSDEIINIFAKHGDEKQKNDAVDILTYINPTSSDRYNEIKTKK